MNDLNEIEQAVVAYILHMSFVWEMVKMLAFSSKAMPQDWAQLISAVLERLKLLWSCCLKEEGEILEQQDKV